MNEGLVFRKSNLSDISKLQNLGKESYSEFSKELSKSNWEKVNSFLENEKLLKNLILQSTVFVCEIESDLIGMIYFVPSGNTNELFCDQWSYIRFLGVSPKHRGKNIGKRLIDLCLDYAKEINEKYVALHTSEFMNPAKAIYEKKGFRQIKEFQYLGKTYWIYLLSID